MTLNSPCHWQKDSLRHVPMWDMVPEFKLHLNWGEACRWEVHASCDGRATCSTLFQSYNTPLALSRGANSSVNCRTAQVPKDYKVKVRQLEARQLRLASYARASP